LYFCNNVIFISLLIDDYCVANEQHLQRDSPVYQLLYERTMMLAHVRGNIPQTLTFVCIGRLIDTTHFLSEHLMFCEF